MVTPRVPYMIYSQWWIMICKIVYFLQKVSIFIASKEITFLVAVQTPFSSEGPISKHLGGVGSGWSLPLTPIDYTENCLNV